jgi:hypothetical protein
VREMVRECRANGRWIGPECFRGRCPPTRGAAGLSVAAPALSISAPSATGLPSRAERTIHPLPVDYASGMGFSSVC